MLVVFVEFCIHIVEDFVERFVRVKFLERRFFRVRKVVGVRGT